MTVTGSQFQSLATKKGGLEPSGELGSGFTLQSSWMMGIDKVMEEGGKFEHGVMDPILRKVAELTGAKIHFDTTFSGQLFGSETSGHPDWIIQYNDKTTVIDCKRGYEHEDKAYWFQPSLYAAAIENGLVKETGKIPVDKIGTTFFDAVARAQVMDLLRSAGDDQFKLRDAAHKILHTITGESQAPELSSVKAKTTTPLASETMGRAVGLLDKINRTVSDLLGKSMEELFNSANPGDFQEQQAQKKQRKALEDVVKLHLLGFYEREDAKRMVGNILSSTGGSVMGGPKDPLDQLKNPQKKEYLFIDLETGGFAEHYGGHGNIPIVTVGYQIFDAEMNPIGSKQEWLINDSALCNNPVAFAGAQEKHGVSVEAMKASHNTFSMVLPELQRLAKGRILGGYNSEAFDMKILSARGMDVSGPRVDAALIAKARNRGIMPRLTEEFKTRTGQSLEGAHGAAADAWAAGMVAQSYLRRGTGNDPDNPDYGNISNSPSWTPAPSHLLSRLGNGAQARISPDGRQIALHNSSGNIFFVGRLANTQAGYTINGKVITPQEISTQMHGDDPVRFADIHERVMNKYGIGGPTGVKAAMDEWYDIVENMTVVNEKAFLSPARAAQIRSAAVRGSRPKSPLQWYQDMQKMAESMKEGPEKESIKRLVYRSSDSRFMFDIVKTIAAYPMSIIKDGKIFAGSDKLVKTVQQMAREQALSTDSSRNFASMFGKPGEELQYGVLAKTMELSILPEGTAMALNRMELFQQSQKNIKNDEGHSLIVLPKDKWETRWENGKLEHAVGYDTVDNQLIWIRAQSASDITNVETRVGANNKWELGYVLRSRGTSQGGQVKSWLNKAVWAELSSKSLDIQSGVDTKAIDLLIQIGKNPRFGADMTLSAEFRMDEAGLINAVRSELGGKVKESEWLIKLDPDQKRKMVNINPAMSGRNHYVNTAIPEVNDAIGRIYSKTVARLRSAAGDSSIDYPMDYMSYRALSLAETRGGSKADFSLPTMDPNDLYEWAKNPSSARKVKVTLYNPLIADMLHLTTLLSKEGTPSLPSELVTVLFDKYGKDLGKLFTGYTKRDRMPYQDIVRTFMVTQGEIEPGRLTEYGRKVITLEYLRDKINLDGDFAGQLKQHLGGDYLYVPPEATSRGHGFYISGEALQFISTPNAINRMKRNIAHQVEGQDEEDPDADLAMAQESIDSTWRQLRNLLKYKDSGSQAWAADKLYDSMFGQKGDKKGLARTQAVWRGATGMVFPDRYGAQGTYTAVPGMPLNEILIGNEQLQKWLPNVSMKEINAAIHGLTFNEIEGYVKTHDGLKAIAQRFPNISNAISALTAFSVVSEDELIRRGKGKNTYARRRGFTGIGLSQMAMDTIFGDTDGDQIAAFLATVYQIATVTDYAQEEGQKDIKFKAIIGIDNNPRVAQMSSFGGRLEHLQRSLAIITGDEDLMHGPVNVDVVMAKMASLSDEVTNVSEIGKWIGQMATMAERYGVDKDGLPIGWKTGVGIPDAYQKFATNAQGKEQMGHSYNRFIRDLELASEASTAGLSGEISSVHDPRAWQNRTNVLFHQLSVDMKEFSGGAQGLVEMTETYNPFSNKEFAFSRTGEKFSGGFDQTVWKIVEQIMGSSTEFRGTGGVQRSDAVNKSWNRDMAAAISSKQETIEKIAAIISGSDLSNPKDIADRIKDEVFGGETGELLGNSGPMLRVPVASMLARGERFGGLAFEAAAKGREDLLALGKEMGQYRASSNGRGLNYNSIVGAISGLRGKAKTIAGQMMSGLTAPKKSPDEMATEIIARISESAGKMTANPDEWRRKTLKLVNDNDYNVMSHLDALVNSGQYRDYDAIVQKLQKESSQIFDADDDHPVYGALDAEQRKQLEGAFKAAANMIMANGRDLHGMFMANKWGTPDPSPSQQRRAASGGGPAGDPGVAVGANAALGQGGRYSVDAGGKVFFVPAVARELNKEEINFMQEYLFAQNPKTMTRDQREKTRIGYGTHRIGGDVLSYQQKLQEGKLNEEQISNFDYKFNADESQQNNLWENYKSGIVNAKYGEGFLDAVVNGGNPFSLMRDSQLTKHGFTTLSNIQGGKGQGDVLGLVDDLRSIGRDEDAQKIFDQFFGSVRNNATNKTSQKRAAEKEKILKGIMSSISKTEDETRKTSAIPASITDINMPEANPKGPISKNELGRMMQRRRPGLKGSGKSAPVADTQNAAAIEGLFQATEGGTDQESLSNALSLYAAGGMSQGSLSKWAGFAKVKGVSGMAAQLDSMVSAGDDQKFSAIQTMSDQSNVGLGGAIKSLGEFDKRLGSVNARMGAYEKLLTELSDPEKYAESSSNSKRTKDRGMVFGGISALKGFYDQHGEEGLDRYAQETGVSKDKLKGIVTKAAALDDKAMGAMQPNGVGQVIASLLGGDTEGLGWMMMNSRRVWNMTGGTVTGAMSDYAKFSTQRQQQFSAFGEGGQQGYTGAAASVIRGENAVNRARLGLGKAGWDIWGGAVDTLGSGSNPDQPGFLSYLGAGVLPVAGAMISKGIISKYMGRYGLGEKMSEGISGFFGNSGQRMTSDGWEDVPRVSSGAVGRVGSALGTIAMGSAAVIGGYEIGKGLGYSIAPALGYSTKGYTADQWSTQQMHNATKTASEAGTMLGGANGVPVAGTLFGSGASLANQIRATSPEGRQINAKLSASEERKWQIENGFGTALYEGDKYAEYNDIARKAEDKLNLPEGYGRATIMRMVRGSGMSASDMSSGVGMEALNAIAGITDDQTQQERVQIAAQMMRGQGTKWGSNSFGQAFVNSANMNNVDVLRTQDTLNRIAPATQFFQATGTSMDDLFGKQTYDPLSGSYRTTGGIGQLTESGQTMFGRVLGGDSYSASKLGVAMNGSGKIEDWMKPYANRISAGTASKMISINPANGTQIGYDWGSQIMMDNYGASAGLAPYQKYANSMGQFNDTMRFGTSTGNYNVSEQGLQQAQFESSHYSNTFQTAQANRQFDLQYAFTTGRSGPRDTGSGGEFTLGGAVTIKLNGETKIMNDVVTGKPIQGRGQWQIEDWGTQLQRFQQQQQFGFQQKGIDLQDKYFMANYGLQQKQFSYDTQYQQQGFAIQQNKMDTQYGWGQQDISLQGASQARGYMYNMQDINEQMRYSTGRERRLLARQKTRATVEYGVSEERLGIESGRLDQRKVWDQQELDRAKDYFDHKITWQKEEFALSLSQHNEELALSKGQLALAIDSFNEENKLRDTATALNRKYWADTSTEEQKTLDFNAKMIKDQETIQANQIILRNLQAIQMAAMVAIWSPDGTLYNALKDFKDAGVNGFTAAGGSLGTMFDWLKTKSDAITGNPAIQLPVNHGGAPFN